VPDRATIAVVLEAANLEEVVITEEATSIAEPVIVEAAARLVQVVIVAEIKPLHEEVASTRVREIFEEAEHAKHAKVVQWDLALGMTGAALAVANQVDAAAAKTPVERQTR